MFTPNADYVWAQDGRFNGEPIQAGDPVDASLIAPRRMEALYDLKKIKPAPGFGEAPPPRYLNNGLGKADQLRAEIEHEEAEAAKDSAKGQGHASAASNRAAAKSNASAVKKPTCAPSPPPAKKAAKSKLAAKSTRNKRAA
jgi:hypothetical protein